MSSTNVAVITVIYVSFCETQQAFTNCIQRKLKHFMIILVFDVHFMLSYLFCIHSTQLWPLFSAQTQTNCSARTPTKTQNTHKPQSQPLPLFIKQIICVLSWVDLLCLFFFFVYISVSSYIHTKKRISTTHYANATQWLRLAIKMI